MATKIFWIHTFDNAASLGTMARPRGNEWLEDEIISCRKQGIDVIVSLLEQEEINELGLRQEETYCKKNGIEFYSFPITDRALPAGGTKTDDFIDMLYAKLVSGLNIVIHCRMGIGRASMIAGGVLLLAGQKTTDIIPAISKARGLQVPDTPEQVKWLKQRESARMK